MNCEQDVFVYSTGWTVRTGLCDNMNAYSANVTAKGTLASSVIIQAYYPLGWFDTKLWNGGAFASAYFQSNYVYVRGQPLLVEWNKN